MDIRIIREPIPLSAVNELAGIYHKRLVKGVADIEAGIIALGGEWHMDANTVLIAEGSKQSDVWGFNVYPQERGGKAIRYTSLINIRPAQGNTSMDVEDTDLQKAIRLLVGKLIPDLGL